MTRRPGPETGGAVRDGDIRARKLVVSSSRLIVESKRLLLFGVERRFQNRRDAENARSVERLRTELDVAEQRLRAARAAAGGGGRSGRLDGTYARLIARAVTCSGRLASSAASLAPSDRLSAAISVQMLDELVEQWREAAANQAPGSP